eukprot:748452-Prorocentrum_minimum.AAC.1
MVVHSHSAELERDIHNSATHLQVLIAKDVTGTKDIRRKARYTRLAFRMCYVGHYCEDVNSHLRPLPGGRKCRVNFALLGTMALRLGRDPL